MDLFRNVHSDQMCITYLRKRIVGSTWKYKIWVEVTDLEYKLQKPIMKFTLPDAKNSKRSHGHGCYQRAGDPNLYFYYIEKSLLKMGKIEEDPIKGWNKFT